MCTGLGFVEVESIQSFLSKRRARGPTQGKCWPLSSRGLSGPRRATDELSRDSCKKRRKAVHIKCSGHTAMAQQTRINKTPGGRAETPGMFHAYVQSVVFLLSSVRLAQARTGKRKSVFDREHTVIDRLAAVACIEKESHTSSIRASSQ